MKAAHGVPVKAQEDIEPTEDDLDEKAYAALLAIFENFIKGIGEQITLDELIEELAALRARFGIDAALKGFEIDFETAVALLNSDVAKLTDEQKKRRDVLLASFDNIIDFAVAEEYQMIEEMDDMNGEMGWGMDLEEGELDGIMDVFEKYNLNYAAIEDGDIEHAMHIALMMYLIEDGTVLTYRTQLDDRVRPWHLALEGVSAPKAIFPEWLIPPIEHGCRCFLEEENMQGKIGDVKDVVYEVPQMPSWFNRTFKESVAKGGRIFSDEHRYFDVKDEDVEKLQGMTERIKKGYWNGD